MANKLVVLPQKCDQSDCPSHRHCHDVATVSSCPEESAGNLDVLFCSDVPFEEDITPSKRFGVRVAFSTKSADLLRDIIASVDGMKRGWAVTSLLRCRTKNRDGTSRKPDKTEIDNCMKHFERDLDVLKPKVIVCHGIQALRMLVDPSDHAKLKYNKVFDVKIGKKNYLALAIIKSHEVLQSPTLLSHYVEGVIKAFDLAEWGTDSIYHPSRWKAKPKITYCDTVEKVEKMVDHLLHDTNQKQACSFDVETRNLNARYGNSLVMLQFCIDPRKEVFVVPYAYQYGPFEPEELEDVKKHLKRLFTEKPGFKHWLTHFGVFEQQQVMQFITDGKTFKNAPMVDIMALAFIMDENRVKTEKNIRQGLGLKMLASEYLGRDEYDASTIASREEGGLYKEKPETLIPYAAEDVISTSLLYQYLRYVAKSQQYWDHALSLASKVFFSAFRLFAVLKRNGIYADLEHLRMLASKVSPLTDRMREIKDELATLPAVKKANEILAKRESGGQRPLFGTPWVFKLDKQEHQQVLFFEVLGLEPVKKNKKKKTDRPSVDKNFYEAYVNTPQNPVPKHVHEVALTQEYTGFKKLATGYTRKIIKLVDPNSEEIDCATDCRVRANFGFTNTVTGRPACERPNIQNVPRADTPTKASVKSMYCAQQSYGAFRPGKKVERVLMELDFAAAEVRWWALISGDTVLGTILRNGKRARDEYRKNPTKENREKAEAAGDIHSQTAALMFGDIWTKSDKAERKKLRQQTKAIVFALIYGGGPHLIAQRIGRENDLDYVKDLIRKFQDRFLRANKWLHEIEVKAENDFYVQSPLGRRRHLPEFLISKYHFPQLEWTHAGARRLARNAPIQGVASDGCIIGAGLFLDYIEENNKDWKIVNIVHDSCVTEVPIGEIEEAATIAEKCFTTRMMSVVRDTWGVEFICPLEVDFKFGVAWGSLKEVDWTKEGWDDMGKWLAAGGRQEPCKTCKKTVFYYGADEKPVVYCKEHAPKNE